MGSITPEWNDREAYKLHLEEAGQECTQMKTNCVWHIAYAQKPM
jgi:hypothetical protein